MEPRHDATPDSLQPRRGFPFGRKRDPYVNPSLERYTDLRFEDRRPRRRRWLWALGTLVTLLALVELALIGAVYWQARHNETRHVDAILVLGAAQWSGRPSPVLEARLQHALDLYHQGVAPTIILTGGSMSGDIYTEGEVSQAWLAKRDVPQNAMIVEKEGRSTWESMQGVQKLLKDRPIHSVLIVSDGFHLFRAEQMARGIGLKPYSSAAPDADIAKGSPQEFSYVLRETAALWVQWPRWTF